MPFPQLQHSNNGQIIVQKFLIVLHLTQFILLIGKQCYSEDTILKLKIIMAFLCCATFTSFAACLLDIWGPRKRIFQLFRSNSIGNVVSGKFLLKWPEHSCKNMFFGFKASYSQFVFSIKFMFFILQL